jgi:hypothetical protein
MYCVYLTEYNGNLLPKYYIGSSSVKRVKGGYHGSVASNEYKEIWDTEIFEHPELFITFILTKHKTRKKALEFELDYQIKNDVVKNPNYINKSLARPNGFHGMDVSGEKNPMYGRSRVGEIHNNGKNVSIGLKRFYQTEEGKKQIKKAKKRKGDKHQMFGKHHSKKSKLQMSIKRIGNQYALGKRYNQKRIKCEKCKNDFAIGSFKRYHIKKCKGFE